MNATLVTGEPAGVYHDNTTHWSNTMLETSRGSLERAYATHVSRAVKTEITSRQQDAFDIGNAVHCAALEPGEFDSRWKVGPTESRKAAKWAEAAALLGQGVKMLQPSVFRMVEMMGARVRSHPVIGPALERASGIAEGSIYWEDAETGLPLKVRPDWMVPPADGAPGVVVDLKTTRDDTHPEMVAKSVVNQGYHRQQALYSMGFEALYGEQPAVFVFAFVSKKPPHEVGAFALDDGSIELGVEQRERDIRRVAAAMDAGSFAQPWNTNVATLVLPSYAHFVE